MAGQTPPVRVLIVDDDPLVRSALALMLGGREDLLVVGEASDGGKAVDAVRDTRPDVVLLDVRMPRVNGIEAVRRLREGPHSPKVLMLTGGRCRWVSRERFAATRDRRRDQGGRSR